MIWIKNKIIPFGRFKAVTIWPFVFYKGGQPSATTVHHENIHGVQQKELFIIPFFLIYLIEFLFVGYRQISFEREAYDNQARPSYLHNRKCYAMWK